MNTEHELFDEANYTLIAELQEWVSEAHRCRELHPRINGRYEILADNRRNLQRQFAAWRGWIIAGTPFTRRQLREKRAARTSGDMAEGTGGQLFDHCNYFRWPRRPYKPAAIITHSYLSADTIMAEAEADGWHCEILPWSWYAPGNTTAAVVTAP